MDRSPNADAGFRSRLALANSSRLTNAVVASLAFASMSLCLVLAMTLAATKLSVAMPLPL